MRNKDLKKLLKEKEPQKIIYMHCNDLIYLTNKQIDELIALRDSKDKRSSKINK